MKKLLEISGLNYSYPDGTTALNGVNLIVTSGVNVGIIGPNGAGKSTLLLHLNGLLKGKGSVRVLDKEITPENLSFIRQKVGLIFQDPHDQLFMPTVYEDVAFGPLNLGLSKDEVEKRVSEALEQVGLSEHKDHISHHMSLGQQRKASIATVLSMSPEIIVLDEPNSNLDHSSRRQLIELLRGISSTKIIATHDLDMILELCQRTALLDKGAIIAEDETRAILSNSSLLASHGLETPPSLRRTDL